MDFIEPCFGIGHNLSLICQMTSEDVKHQLIIIIIINWEINEFNQFLSQILATLMVQYERSRCVITSPPLFIFWLLKTVFDVLPFYTKIMLKVRCPRLPPQYQGFLLQGFKVLLSFLPLGARKRSYIITRHSLWTGTRVLLIHTYHTLYIKQKINPLTQIKVVINMWG